MTQNQKGLLFGVVVMAIAAAWSILIYKAIEPLDREALRGLAVFIVGWLLPIGVVVGVLLTRRLTVNEAHAHERGIDKGIEKVTKAAQATADIRQTMHTTIKRPPDGWKTVPVRSDADYLPRPRMEIRGGGESGISGS
jgi:hypothetical protein